MSIRRKLIIAVGLAIVIPFLTILYVAKSPSVYAAFSKNLVVYISLFISVLGVAVFVGFIRTIVDFCNNIKVISKGDLSRQVEPKKSENIEELTGSISQLVQRMRRDADDLEDRTILIQRFNKEIGRMNDFVKCFPEVIHELRTPLINIDMAVCMLSVKHKDAFDEHDARCVGSISSNVKRLFQLVNNMLDMAKMETQGLLLQYVSCSVDGLVREALDCVEKWRQSRGLSLETAVAQGLPDFFADKDRLVQVMVNLISNAIKFTPVQGKIVVGCRRHAAPRDFTGLSDDEKTEFVEFFVEDTGPGIPAAQQEAIFERYKTISGDASAVFHSTGLGLAIAREIVELHGGKIWVESRAGKGSRFIFTVPARTKPPAVETPVPA
ncbi:MAG: HAMP domain-containing sensor histidine kinase [Candidatus Omnitrophica bacterium]|nr:HAMP domain-containing sensor histidine kinase [Candidatus Omnitrophota bacterium]